MAMQLNFNRNGFGYRFTLEPSNTGGLFFTREEYHFRHDHTPNTWRPLGTGAHPEALLPDEGQHGAGEVPRLMMADLRRWHAYHFNDTSEQSPLRQAQNVGDNHCLRSNGANLAPFLYRLEQTFPDEFHRITELVQRVAPFFAEFVLRQDEIRPDLINLAWRHHGSDAYFDSSSLSDGTLRFMCLATLLLQPRRLMPSLILIDEPELGQHPAALTLLAELLRGASASSFVQIIVATQSVTLLDHFTPDEVIVADLADGASIFYRLDEDALRSWLEDYSLGELWLKNVLGGRPQ